MFQSVKYLENGHSHTDRRMQNSKIRYANNGMGSLMCDHWCPSRYNNARVRVERLSEILFVPTGAVLISMTSHNTKPPAAFKSADNDEVSHAVSPDLKPKVHNV